jgi:putative transposase
MKRQSGHIHKLCPSAEQAAKMACFAGMARYVYNRSLALQNEQYERLGKHDGVYTLKKLLPRWKNEKGTEWLSQAPSQGLQSALLNLGDAWKRFFDPKLPNAEAPTFHKRRTHCSYAFPQGFKVDQTQHRVWLPKLGWIPYVFSRKLCGTHKSVTIRRKNNVWYMTVLCEREVKAPRERREKQAGVDVGIACQAMQDDGTRLKAPKQLRRLAQKVSALQSLRDRRQKKGSGRHGRASRRITKLQERIGNIRKDHLHKFTTQLVKNQDVVCVEDLKVKNMSKPAKGTKEKPGKKVAQKRGLNRSILEQGWCEMRRQLTYKMAWSGGLVVAVPPQYTSQRCSDCLAVDRKSRLSQARFVCTACGVESHADINAAKNILAAGRAVIARGANGDLAVAMKRESTWAA